jgi:hypothetical protein
VNDYDTLKQSKIVEEESSEDEEEEKKTETVKDDMVSVSDEESVHSLTKSAEIKEETV